MRSRCAAGILHRRAVFSFRIAFLVHLTIRSPNEMAKSEPLCDQARHRKTPKKLQRFKQLWNRHDQQLADFARPQCGLSPFRLTIRLSTCWATGSHSAPAAASGRSERSRAPCTDYRSCNLSWDVPNSRHTSEIVAITGPAQKAGPLSFGD
jgi:hypothetical protein